MTDQQKCDLEMDKLIDIWRVLVTLSVSLDRIGEYWLVHGEDAAKNALHQFMNPSMNHEIANARRTLEELIETCDPNLGKILESYGDDEDSFGFWNGPE